MCGIAGFLTRAGGNGHGTAVEGLTILADMGSAIAHRGPDDSGELFLADEGIGLAHRRLSIIDFSPAGHQPMSSACGRYMLVFNGEIYNFLDIKTSLPCPAARPLGVERPTRKSCSPRFAPLVSKPRSRNSTACSPLRYGTDRSAASRWRATAPAKSRFFTDLCAARSCSTLELRALCAYPGFEKTIDPQALERYLRFLAVPAPDAIFKGVRKLPPGEFVTVSRADLDAGLPGPKPYWRSESSFVEARANQLDIDMEQAVDMLDAIMRRAVGRRMFADVPLGAFLSGGFDSTLVVAMMQARSSRPVRTFTIGFDDESFDSRPLRQRSPNILEPTISRRA